MRVRVTVGFRLKIGEKQACSLLQDSIQAIFEQKSNLTGGSIKASPTLERWLKFCEKGQNIVLKFDNKI